MPASPLAALLAAALELAFGFPDRLWRAVGHPVSWAGRLIAALERGLNRGGEARRRLAGVLALALVVGTAWGAGWAVSALGWAAAALAGSSLVAQRSLAAHVAAVADGLDQGLAAGRTAVSRIVGRDVEVLDEGGVARAAVESLAENFSDGVVAPLLWMALLGLPAGAAYKAINTADSMIGHRSARYRAFGWAAARLDDLVNLPASRLSGLLLCAAALLLPGASAAGAWRAVRRDAGGHRSPNAGWPEAAMAGALGFSLAGPRSYGGVPTADAEMGAGGRRALTAADIRRALRLYWLADALLLAGLAAMAILLW